MSAAKNTTPVSVTCPKCGGGQKIAQFKHVENGVCFLCNGAGVTDAATAAGLSASAAKPYTVSVGIATSLPSSSKRAA